LATPAKQQTGNVERLVDDKRRQERHPSGRRRMRRSSGDGPTCRCAIHQKPQTWRVTCSVCKLEKWPYLIEKPTEPYICTLCRVTPAATREAKKRASTAAWAARRAQQPQRSTEGA